MRIVVFGLTISSSWGNGHATLWRGLAKALARRRCGLVFFERDVPYYAGTRDLWELPGGELVLYADWTSIRAHARDEVAAADAVIVTSYCPDGAAAAELVADAAGGLTAFYDLDTPITLAAVRKGDALNYIGPRGLRDFDLVLSFTGGPALRELQQHLGARNVHPLYGHVDPDVHRPVAPLARYAADLSYLGTYAADRQSALISLFLEPARAEPGRRFLIGGAQYPQDFPWSENIYFVRHLPPEEHPAFFSSSRLTLNVTRRAMAEMGWCPSGRLFEAAACGAAILSDKWEGLPEFFTPGREILTAGTAEEVISALHTDDAELQRIGAAARARARAEHTSDRRAQELLDALASTPPAAMAGGERLEA